MTQDQLHNFTKLALTRLISDHQKALLRCLTQLHTDFQVVPVDGLPCRLVNRSIFIYENNRL